MFLNINWLYKTSLLPSKNPGPLTRQRKAKTLTHTKPLILGTILFGVFGTLSLITSAILLNGFTQVENKIVGRNVERAVDELSDQLQRLSETTRDFSQWDATYNFIQNPNSQYIQSDFGPSLATLHLNLVIFLRQSGEQVFTQAFDYTKNKELPFPKSLDPLLQSGDLLLQHSSSDSSHVGFVVLPQGPLMVASQPILPTNGKKPIGGSLILGRYLNSVELQNLATKIHVVDAQTYPVQSANPALLPENLQQVQSSLLQGKRLIIQPLSLSTVAGYTLLKDIYGKPALLLQVKIAREVFQQALWSLLALNVSLLALGVLIGWMIRWFMQQSVKYVQDRDRLEKILLQEMELAQITLQSIGDGVITTDADGNVELLNPVAELITGWTIQEAMGLPLREVFDIEDDDSTALIKLPLETILRDGLQMGSLQSSHSLISRAGQRISIDYTVSRISRKNAAAKGVVLVFRDVTETRNMARLLAWQASFDALTGLMNRREFERRLELAVSEATLQNTEHSLCFLDLDYFKVVNDSCGHAAGDELLRQISALIRQSVRKADLVARLGGDEFGIILFHCSVNEAELIAQEVCRQVREYQFVWQDRTFKVGASIGLLSITATSLDSMQLFNLVDTACYAAKNHGRGRVFIYHPNQQELATQASEAGWVQRLTRALEENLFCLYGQEIAPLKPESAKLEHYEVLLRMFDEGGNLVLPNTFLPAAERYNLMPAIDRWVVSKLLETYVTKYEQSWHHFQKDGIELVFGINLSAASLGDQEFTKFLIEQFQRYNIPPQIICFEINETVAVANLSRTNRFVQQLKAIGCKFALDDFGAAMSSFAYLKKLPIDYLKIDGSLIRDIDNPSTFATIEAITRISQVMDMRTIAKFVSSEGVSHRCSAAGIDYAQGFGIAKPRPLA
jgi:diguanylate cyclase (GGDEF)-like protein/PAS domain S-box-containing protein